MADAAVTDSAAEFRRAREFLLNHREDYAAAYAGFQWPQFDRFNWALDWFDALALAPDTADQPALWIVEEDGRETKLTFAELSARSNQVANWLRGLGVERGDRVILMLGNQVELWEAILAIMKLGAVLIPASTMLGPIDLVDRVTRGNAKHVIARSADTEKFAEIGRAHV